MTLIDWIKQFVTFPVEYDVILYLVLGSIVFFTIVLFYNLITGIIFSFFSRR